jgi:spoIIIJ-associated protein
LEDLPAGPERDAQVAALAGDMLLQIITLMGFEARVDTEWRDADNITDDHHLLLSVHGRDLSALIGRRGETLENLQYLLRLMVNQKMHRWLNIIVDVEEFRAKRVDHLTKLAQRMADQVTETQRSFALEPMPPNERRIVHLALRDSETVFTESTGEGERRKVTIFPKH